MNFGLLLERFDFMKTLPNKPSALIRVALTDLYKIEKDKNYRVDMSMWHFPRYNVDVCSVCFAGSVMAKTLNSVNSKLLFPDSFALPIQNKLLALNEFRRGRIDSGFDYMAIKLPKKMKRNRHVPFYSLSPSQFKSKMRRIANDLKNQGF